MSSTPLTTKFACFISYSSQDEAFAQCLHADLTSRGVSVWFAPHDLKIGARIRQTLDEAIGAHDKLLLILSESSINSDWVEKEVETAFEKERDQRKAGTANPTVLFPIMIDDAVWNTPQAWAADIRRMRNIGDFRQWRNPPDYQNALTLLLRDLQP